jgi:hypothetical protein
MGDGLMSVKESPIKVEDHELGRHGIGLLVLENNSSRLLTKQVFRSLDEKAYEGKYVLDVFAVNFC